MRSFCIFFEQFITKKRRKAFGKVTYPGDDTPVVDVEEYKKRREKDTAKQFTPTEWPGGSIIDTIRYDTNKELQQLMDYYGFSLKEGLNGLPKDGSLVYRGHKNIDPFTRGEDAKAEEGKVYFSSNANYAYSVYSVNYNTQSSQIGQKGFSSLQSLVSEPRPDISFDVGFFTVATPKDPDNIKWYYNFGYEDKQPSFTRKEKDITGIRDAECVEPKEAFSKIRTYLMYKGYMISFDRLKKVSPRIYKEIMNTIVYKSAKDPLRVM